MVVRELRKMRFQPISFANQIFHHVNTLGPKHQKEFMRVLMQELKRLPEDLFCGHVENEELKEKKLRQRVENGEITKAEAKALFEQFKLEQGNRMKVEDYTGDVDPLNWAARVSDNLSLGFQMYGIKILNRSGRDVSVGCHIWPMLFTESRYDFTSAPFIRILMEITKGLLTNIIRSEDGTVRARVDVVDIMPITANISTNMISEAAVAGVKNLIRNDTEIKAVPFSRFGKDYHVFVRR